MIIQNNITFCEEAKTPMISKSFFNPHSDVLALQVMGNFTNGKVVIEGSSGLNAPFVPLMCINLSDYTATNAISKAGMYELSVISIREIRMSIAEIESGYVTVLGSLINSEEV